jgi:hypothetical protein
VEYWLKQTPDRPVFPDIEWSKPERRQARGKLLLVGGSALGFVTVGRTFKTALAAGAGQVKVVLPDRLKKDLPPDFTEGIFLPTNPGGGFSKDGLGQLTAAAEWSDGILLIGDSGQNSQTAVLFEQLISQTDRTVTVARDAIDLLRHVSETLVKRENTHLTLSFAQLQKLFGAVYYPKILTFSMQLTQLVEALHKFTISYPLSLTSFHQNHLIAASAGQVVTMPFNQPTEIWNGNLVTREATYLLWTPKRPLGAVATAWLGYGIVA